MNSTPFLIVDDSKISQRVIAKALMGYGVKESLITYASTTDEAKRKWRHFDKINGIVFLDIVLPGMGGGIGLLEKFKKDEPEARIIIQSSRTDRASVLEARRLGAISYLLKPFSFEKVSALLDKLVKAPGNSLRND